MTRPAEALEGLQLDDGWIVEAGLAKTPDQTGGNFSRSYLVRNSNGTRAFLKAMDYQDALRSPDPAVALNAMTNAYIFERNLLRLCREKKLSRIVRAISDGKAMVMGQPVEYLIFELADGDIRKYLSQSKTVDLAWRLRCLHNVFIGAHQLNTAKIAHQDLKPSNVLTYAEQGQKLADLGRAWSKDNISPFDELLCAGDRRYAPPELLYRGSAIDDATRRFSTDFYLLGSMVFFLFSGIQITAAVTAKLAPDHHFLKWTGSYADVLPYISHSFSEVLIEFKNEIAIPVLADELTDIVEQMCDPDFNRRGDRLHRAKVGSRFNLQRFVQRFDRLARQAEMGKMSMS